MGITRLLSASLLLWISVLFASAQTGHEFWLAAPNISKNHANNSIPLNLHITALYKTTVTISRPADPNFKAFQIELNDQESDVIRLDTDPRCQTDVADIEVYEKAQSSADFIQNKGFLIKASPGEITCYYELQADNNRDILPLKAENALGKEFWVSTQNAFKNQVSDSYSGFTVVATQDNTVVYVEANGNNLAEFGTSDFSVTLKKGQAFAVRAAGRMPGQHIQGVYVHSTKNIVINIYDDSMRMSNSNGGYDTFADQIVPVSLVGMEYIVLKGNISKDTTTYTYGTESVFFTATEPNTEIYIDGVLKHTIAAPGGYFRYQIFDSLATHIRCSAPTYVNHITGYATDASGGTELGGALLPPIDNCTGSHMVTIKKSPDPSSFAFFNNLMVRNDTSGPNKNQAIHHFTYTINNGTPKQIPPGHFKYIMDSTFAVYDRTLAKANAYYNSVVNNDILRIENNLNRFHIGVMSGNKSGGCKYGYFSDYAASDADAGIGGVTAGKWIPQCNNNPVRLVAGGGRSYEWHGTYDASLELKLSETDIADPYFYPDTNGTYDFYVLVGGECNSTDSIPLQVTILNQPIPDFGVDAYEGCSPFQTTIYNLSDDVTCAYENWVLISSTGAFGFDQDTIPRTFDYTFPENTSDTIETYRLQLTVKGPGYSCPMTKYKEIKVKPEINAGFTVPDTAGCHPFPIDIINTSTGHLDTASYFWDFGDNSQSFEETPLKTYNNYSFKDSTYILKLITESPYGCKDSTQQKIVVYPRVRTALAIDTALGCSPLTPVLNPSNSVGVDTLHWHIDYFYGDSTYATTSKAPIKLYHTDTSTVDGPDTLLINLVGINRFGCTDTVSQRKIIVLPLVIADLTIDENEICDSQPILFTNHSTGHDLFFEWDFGDGTIKQDVVGKDYNKIFYNRSDQDTTYNITLRATSGYFCESEKDTSIVVHPYIRADFGIIHENTCVPLDVEFNNSSVRVHQYDWDFGDGNTSTTSLASFGHQFWNPLPDRDTTYIISLKVQNNEGCRDSLTRKILLSPNVVADFTISDESSCSPISLVFNNLSTGNNLSYLWEFGDNTTSTSNNAAFTHKYVNYFSQDTTYYITLKATNKQGCDSLIMDSITVFAEIDANFNIPISDSCSPFIIRPENSSSAGAHFYEWDFGPSGTSSLENPIVPVYKNLTTTADTVNISLIAYGMDDAEHKACADTHQQKVVIYPELNIDFDLSEYASCQPFLATISNNSNIKSGTAFNWFLDNKYYDAKVNPKDLLVENLNTTSKTHTLKVIGTSQYGCRDTLSKDFTVYSHVKSYFVLDKEGICSFDSVEIDRSDAFGGITSYEWDFGDGTSSSRSDALFNIPYDNTTSNAFNRIIRLTVSNTEGCDSTWTDTIQVYPELRTSFDMDKYTSCQPLIASFTNTTNIHNGTQYRWFLNNQFYSSQQTPKDLSIDNLTSSDKTYSIELRGESQYGCKDTIQKNVTVYSLVDARFTVDKPGLCSFDEIEIDRSASAGGITSYNWDFGEGNTSTRTDAVFNYPYENTTNSAFNRTITLTVANNKGCDSTWTESIQVYPELRTSFELDNYEGCQPLVASVTNNTNIISGTSFKWIFDDAFYSSLTSPNALTIANLSAQDKSHSLTLIGNSQYGCKDTIVKDVVVYSLVDANFSISKPAICSGDSIFVDRSASDGGLTGYAWNFNNENTSNRSDAGFFHSYDNLGASPVAKFITLTVNNTWGCDSTITKNVTVYPKVTADFEFDDNTVCYPYVTQFTNLSNNANTYNWNFGDGASSSASVPTHEFNNLSNANDVTYSVKLRAKSQYSCYDSIRKDITVYAKPVADFYFPVAVDCPPFAANMVNLSEGATLSYIWNFAGEGSSTDKDPEFIFGNETHSIVKKPIELIVTSIRGCSDTLSKDLSVYPNIHVNFTMSDYDGCSPMNVQLTSDTFNVAQMLWTVNDKSFSQVANPLYRFVNDSPSDKTYQVIAHGTSTYNCIDSDTNYITLYPTPTAEFIPDPLLQDYDPVLDQTDITFYNETTFQDNWSYEWEYGDGNRDNQSARTFEYIYGDKFWGDINNRNKVPVRLISWNTDNPECRDTVLHDIIIIPPLPEIDLAEDIAGCEPYTVDFSSTTKYAYEIYEWDFGVDGAKSTDAEPTFTFTEPGVYSVRLVIYGDGGTNWDYKLVTVYPKPEVDFSFNDSVVIVQSQVESNDTINFYNHTKFGQRWEWYFDANNLESGLYDSDEKNPTHFYTDTGTYHVALLAESEYGCIDTKIHPTAIRVIGEGFVRFPNGFFLDPAGPVDGHISNQQDTRMQIFRPYASGVVEYKLEVYNRWGVLVFKSKDVNYGWNGYIDGKPGKQDVYIWRATGRFSNGQPFEENGDVTLIVASPTLPTE